MLKVEIYEDLVVVVIVSLNYEEVAEVSIIVYSSLVVLQIVDVEILVINLNAMLAIGIDLSIYDLPD